MKTYSVKQIAQMLDTNPETVRRWIRDDKLKAIQVSRKDGNIVTEDELQRFLKATPKYFTKFTASATATATTSFSPAIGIATLAGGIIASALLGYIDEKSKTDVRVRPEDFKKYLKANLNRLNETINQKRDLIKQTEVEMAEIQKQIEQYTYLLNHDDIIKKTLSDTSVSEE